MDRILYKAATEGNIGVLMEKKDRFEEQMTPTNNTVLHVTAQFHNRADIVREILEAQSSLLLRVNSRGETALHIAARNGHFKTVEALIGFAKTQSRDPESGVEIIEQLVRTTSENKDTALHEAVRSNHFGVDRVVKLLVEEDKGFSHVLNNSDETPLYLAAERDYHEIVSIILTTCTSPAFNGPNGRTALHAAVFSGCIECVEKLLLWRPSLTKKGDLHGWTPLHRAARQNDVKLMRILLYADKKIAYQIAEEYGKMTALHLAALNGKVEAMEELLSRCPDCWEMVNDRGQNILHIAIEYEKVNVVRCILKKKQWVGNLLNQKDKEGNTPLHMLAVSNFLSLDPSQLISHPLADMCAFNKENLTPRDKATSVDSFRLFEDIIIKMLDVVKAPSGRRNIAHDDSERIKEWKKNHDENKNTIRGDLCSWFHTTRWLRWQSGADPSVAERQRPLPLEF